MVGGRIIRGRTSRSKYWYHGISKDDTLRWGAPRNLMTYSDQNIIVSLGDFCLNFMIKDF